MTKEKIIKELNDVPVPQHIWAFPEYYNQITTIADKHGYRLKSTVNWNGWRIDYIKR